MKRIVTIERSSGRVDSEWSGGEEQTLASVARRTHLTLPDGDTGSYSGHRWTGSAFERLPPVAPISNPVDDQLWRIETKMDELLSR